MAFLEMFSFLSLSPKAKDELNNVELERIKYHSLSKVLEVVVTTRHMIPAKVVDEFEIKLADHFQNEYPGCKATIREKFNLSSQYNPEAVWENYKEVFIREISKHGNAYKSLLPHLSIDFEGYNVKLQAKEQPIIMIWTKEISSWIKHIYDEFFDMNIECSYEFIPVSDEDAVSSYESEMGSTSIIASEESVHLESMESITNDENVAAINASVSGDKGPGDNLSATASSANENNSADMVRNEQPKTDTPKSEAPKKDDKFNKSNNFGKQNYSDKFKTKKAPVDDPDIFTGKPFEGDVIPISSVADYEGDDVIVRGMLFKTEIAETKSGKLRFSANVTDFTDSIAINVFKKPEEDLEKIKAAWKDGTFVKIKAVPNIDKFSHELGLSFVTGIKTIPDFTVKRKDEAKVKRVEFHAHTKMSEMDAVVEPGDLVKTAVKWGHRGVAITDHGVVYGFTDAFHKITKMIDDEKDPEKKEKLKEFKIVYGVEGYLVDDEANMIAKGDVTRNFYDTVVAFDIETTGLNAERDRIIEIGAIKLKDNQEVDRFCTFVNPCIPIPPEIEKLTHISDEHVMSAPTIDKVMPQFLEFIGASILVAHNADFDVPFITAKAKELGIDCSFTSVDTVGLSRYYVPKLNNYKLDTVCKALNITLESHHRATDDAKACADIYLELLKKINANNIRTLAELNSKSGMSPELIKAAKTHHVCLLCQNEPGRINLYRMISRSHLDFFKRFPRIPKSLVNELHEGILVGSACEAGELYKALLNKASQEEITRICSFYDYFEIMPIGNNRFMIEKQDHGFENINSEQDIIDINKEIIRLAHKFNKPVIATGDVHFLNPEDEMYRRMLLAAKDFDDADNQAPLYMRTTDEMMQEFAYLDEETQFEVVVENPNKLLDMIDRIEPVRPDKCPPVIPNSDKILNEICYNKAHSMYGPELPPIVEERLKRELNSIISNGFAVMYIIAQKLVWKSNEDGYLVGSRGSVGSSFVATMAGITEVNPLPAHYYCTNCFYSDFDKSEEVISYSRKGISGCDLPSKNCPVCGKPLNKDGHNIPFETFLGFKGNKEPDIDLNFSGEYQSKAHDYTGVIFGDGQTFRAGTIGGVAEKTAIGYVKKYNETRGIDMRSAELERVAKGCEGVRRTTGQHPGGIIVLPFGEDINSFTPIQRPANDENAKSITTHFDYHSIDHNLLKLDILGHDDPTMIRKLEDLTGLDAKTIPMDDPKVLSLLRSPEALGITPDDIGGIPVGSLGLPELGTNFVIGMLVSTQPTSFSEVVRISGLSHGTDVWSGNAEVLIKEGTCTLSNAICTRDDIMLYLIDMGLDKEFSFKIMESVRKGKGLKPEMEEDMIKHGVPDWYITSCKRIKYMFPKAHAVAYVTMAFRVAYFKVYHPLAYYAAYFSIRADGIDYESMCTGRANLEKNMQLIKKKIEMHTATEVEKDKLIVMQLVQEMYARGIDFLPIDVFKAKAHEFIIVDGKLMPSLTSIEGLGGTAAEGVEAGANGGAYVSLEDFSQRCKVGMTTVDKLVNLGILRNLPRSSQISLFDILE